MLLHVIGHSRLALKKDVRRMLVSEDLQIASDPATITNSSQNEVDGSFRTDLEVLCLGQALRVSDRRRIQGVGYRPLMCFMAIVILR